MGASERTKDERTTVVALRQKSRPVPTGTFRRIARNYVAPTEWASFPISLSSMHTNGCKTDSCAGSGAETGNDNYVMEPFPIFFDANKNTVKHHSALQIQAATCQG